VFSLNEMDFEERMKSKVTSKKLFIKVIALAVMISFLCQNIAWAIPDYSPQTTVPNDVSKVEYLRDPEAKPQWDSPFGNHRLQIERNKLAPSSKVQDLDDQIEIQYGFVLTAINGYLDELGGKRLTAKRLEGIQRKLKEKLPNICWFECKHGFEFAIGRQYHFVKYERGKLKRVSDPLDSVMDSKDAGGNVHKLRVIVCNQENIPILKEAFRSWSRDKDEIKVSMVRDFLTSLDIDTTKDYLKKMKNENSVAMVIIDDNGIACGYRELPRAKVEDSLTAEADPHTKLTSEEMEIEREQLIDLIKATVEELKTKDINTVYYPGIGEDIERVLLGTNAQTIVGVDPLEYLTKEDIIEIYGSKIKNLGGKNIAIDEAGTLGNGGKLIFSFNFEGESKNKPRKIILYREDFTKYTPDKIGETKDGYDICFGFGVQLDLFTQEFINACLLPLDENGLFLCHDITADFRELSELNLPLANKTPLNLPNVGPHYVWIKSKEREPAQIAKIRKSFVNGINNIVEPAYFTKGKVKMAKPTKAEEEEAKFAGLEKITFEDINKLKNMPNFKRLGQVLGFTGIGPDMERKHVTSLAVKGHDLRVAKVSRTIAERFGAKPELAEFIGLTHDYAALPFRHFMNLGSLGKKQKEAGYNAKQHNIDLLEQDGFSLSEALKIDLLNFDINTKAKISDEAKIAIACESVEGAVEDIMFGLKYGLFTYNDIPKSILGLLHLDKIGQSELEKRIDKDFDNVVVEVALGAFLKEDLEFIAALVNKATTVKNTCRRDLIVEKIFKVSNTPEAIAAAEEVLVPVYENYIRQYRKDHPGIKDESLAVLHAIDQMVKMSDDDVVKWTRLKGSRPDLEVYPIVWDIFYPMLNDLIIVCNEEMSERFVSDRTEVPAKVFIDGIERTDAPRPVLDIAETVTPIEEDSKYDQVSTYSYGNYLFNAMFVVFKDRKIFHRAGEPVFAPEQKYTMIVRWKDKEKGITSEDVTFEKEKTTNEVKVYIKGLEGDQAGNIELAFFGERLIHKGKPVSWEEIYNQFDDMFHLYLFPQIVQDKAWKDGIGWTELFLSLPKKDHPVDRKKLLDVLNNDGLLENIDLQPYFNDGYTLEQIKEYGLEAEHRGYWEKEGKGPLKEGEYSIVDNRFLNVRLIKSRYPHNLIGITKRGNIVMINLTGDKGKEIGYTIEEVQAIVAKESSKRNDPIQELFLLANGPDVIKRVNGKFVSKTAGARDKVTAVIVLAAKVAKAEEEKPVVLTPEAEKLLPARTVDINSYSESKKGVESAA